MHRDQSGSAVSLIDQLLLMICLGDSNKVACEIGSEKFNVILSHLVKVNPFSIWIIHWFDSAHDSIRSSLSFVIFFFWIVPPNSRFSISRI